MTPFDLSIQSFKPPTLTQPRDDLEPSHLAPTSPLYINLALPYASRPKAPLFPATHLQLAYVYRDTRDIFVPIAPERLGPSRLGSNCYQVKVAPNEIPRAKVKQGASSTVEVFVYAWKGEKLLGKWKAGEVENLGINA